MAQRKSFPIRLLELGVYLVAVPIAVARILWLMVQGSRSQRDCTRCRRDARDCVCGFPRSV